LVGWIDHRLQAADEAPGPDRLARMRAALKRYLLDRFQSGRDEVVTLFAQTIHDRRAVNGG
jgi:hypothetical protein